MVVGTPFWRKPATRMPASQTPSSPTKPGYMPQLDGIRAIAVLAVVLSHASGHFLPDHDWMSHLSPLGNLGVRCFFVLSGFLITGILLRCRSLIGEQGIGFTLRQFFARRFLRILPVYLCFILTLGIFDYSNVRENLVWYLTSTINVKQAISPGGFSYLDHMWSLAVEEQFYVLWPLLILSVPRRILLPLCLAVTASGPIWVVLVDLIDLHSHWAHRQVLGNLETLGGGATLAVASFRSHVARDRFVRFALFGGTLAVCVGMASYAIGKPNALSHMLMLWGFSFLFIVFIAAAGQGISNPVGMILQSRPMVYIGSISYGIYIFHYPLIDVIQWLTSNLWYRWVLAFSLPILVATASWYLLELPVNRLKKRFPYRRPPVGPLLK